MKIGLDFDGVISDCGKLKSNSAKKIYGIDIPPDGFKKEIVVKRGLLTIDQYHELQRIIYETDCGLDMEPISGVFNYLPKLIEEGHTILVVTSRGEKGVEIARKWSEGRGLKLKFTGVGYGNSKAEAVDGIDLYVDDDFDKLEPLIDIIPNCFLFSQNYNINVDVGSVVKRIISWEHLYNTIQTLKDSGK